MSSISPTLSNRSCSEGGMEDERSSNVAISSPSAVATAFTSQLDKSFDGDNHRRRLEQLKSHPLFGDLQVTLALDCLQSKVPYSLLSDSCDPVKLNTPLKSDPAFKTVSDKIIEQHVNLQKTLLNVRMYFPTLLTAYHRMSDQVEAERYKALTYNCHSDNIKQLVNWFYDCERQLLMDRIQETVNVLMNKTKSLLPGPTNMNASFLNSFLTTSTFAPPPPPVATTLFPPVIETEAETPLDLSASLNKDAGGMPSMEKKSRFLSKKAVAILQRWYHDHRDHPYATDEEVKELAAAGGIAPNQVKKWMANTRARSYNTLTYNGGKHILNSKMAMKKRLLHKYKIEPTSSSSARHFQPLPLSAAEKCKDEHIDVETVSRQSSPVPSEANSEFSDYSSASKDSTQPASKPSLEQVIARCRLKSGEAAAEIMTNKSVEKSAIESLKDVVNNVSKSISSTSDEQGPEEPRLEASQHGDRSPRSPKRYLSPHAKTTLSEWFRKHLYRPYPTYEEKRELAALCGISSSKVDTWFANKRNRTHNTKKFPPKYSHMFRFASSD